MYFFYFIWNIQVKKKNFFNVFHFNCREREFFQLKVSCLHELILSDQKDKFQEGKQ